MRDVGGKPLIQWTVEAALRSKIERVVVSTEDVEIATIAKQLGADVVPQPLASALSGKMSAPVVMAALDFLRDTEGFEPEWVCLLHPTSPFRTEGHIDKALAVLNFRKGKGSVVTFTEDELNGALYLAPTKSFRKYGTFFFAPLWPLPLDVRSGLDIDTWDDLDRAREVASGRV